MHVPHLVPGVTVQFRVRAHNYGGWGMLSEESEFMMAGEQYQVTTIETELSAMAKFGPRQLISLLGAPANRPRSPLQQLGLLMLGGLARHIEVRLTLA